MSDASHVAHVDVQIRWLEYLVAIGDHTKAYTIAHDLLGPSCHRRGLEVRRAVVMYLAALSASESMDADGSDSALPTILQCQSTCARLGLRTLESRCAILRSRIQMKRGNSLDGLRQLDVALPDILAHCSARIQGDAHLCRAKCLLSMASQGVEEESAAATGGNEQGGKKRLSRRTYVEVSF